MTATATTKETSGKRRPVLISFSGIDGAGKSTQIEMLRSHLIAYGARVRLISFWDDVAVLTVLRESAVHTLFKGEKGVGTPERPVNRRDKNVRSWYMTGVRLLLYFLEAVSLRAAARREWDADVIIFDRYLYDQLANLPIKTALIRLYARLLLRLVYKPDVAYLIDADPESARARKPEYPLEFLRDSRARYLILREMEGLTLVPAGPVGEVTKAVIKVFCDEFPARERQGVRSGVRESVPRFVGQ